MLDSEWDAIVIGAGPAGSVSALLLARANKKILLVDKATFPRTKVCGSCLSSKTTAYLKLAGLDDLIEDCRAAKIKEFKLCTASGAVRLPLPNGYALSREKLDYAIIKKAELAGVKFMPTTSASVADCDGQFRAVNVANEQGRQTVFARSVIIADGINGQALTGLTGDEAALFKPVVSKSSRIGAGTVIPASADGSDLYKSGTIYMAVNAHGYAGVVKLENGDLDLAAAFDTAFIRKCGSPQAAAKNIITGAGLPFLETFEKGLWHGTAPFTRERHCLAAKRLFVVGDAASYGEPFTGEGIAWAIYGALQMVPYINAGIKNWDDSLASGWQMDHKKNIAAKQQMSRRLGALLRHQEISNFLIGGILKNMPALARPIVDRISR